MRLSTLRHVHARRKQLARDLRVRADFELWEETCVPSYCHSNLAAAYLSWARLYAAVALARRHADWHAVLDFGAGVGELRHLLPAKIGRYDFVEENETAADYLLRHIEGARRETLDSAPTAAYSAAFALDALEHNTDFDGILVTLAKKLSPDGVLIVSGPTETWLYRLGRRIAGFEAHYHETDIFAIERSAAEKMQRIGGRSLPPGLPIFRLSAWAHKFKDGMDRDPQAAATEE